MKRIGLNVKLLAPDAPTEIRYLVDSYSKHEVGGCEKATIRAVGIGNGDGDLVSVQAALNLIGTDVQINNDIGDPRWWGRVVAVTLNHGKMSMGVEIDGMANRIAVAYSDYTGRRGTTAWIEDAASKGRFGRKELLLTLNDADQTAAESYAANMLNEIRRPVGVASFEHTSQGDLPGATLHCIGYFHLLDWIYYQYSGGVHEHALGGGEQNFGEGSGINRISQVITPPASATPFTHLTLPIQKIGDPTDWVTAEIRTGSVAGAGSLIAYADFYPASMDIQTMREVKIALDSSMSPPNGDAYHIEIFRNGSADITNYYRVGVDTTRSYAGGAMQVRVGATWQNGIPNDADLQFRLTSAESTTVQIARAAATSTALTSVVIEAISDIATTAFRNGDNKLMKEVEELLRLSRRNNLRLIAEVTPFRQLRVYQEPDGPQYSIDKDANLFHWSGAMVDKSTCPVGVKAKLRDVFPMIEASVNLSQFSVVSIESAEYSINYDADGNPTSDDLRYIPRGARDPFRERLENG